MKKAYVSFFVLSFCVCLTSLQFDTSLGIAQDSSTKVSAHQRTDDLPSGESVLAKYVESIGGKAALEKMKSIQVSGNMANDLLGHKFEAKITTTSVAPNKFRLALEHPQFSMVQVTNGKQAWQWRDGGNHGAQGETNWIEKKDSPELFERAVFNPQLNWQKLYKSVETIGRTKIANKDAYQVQVTTHDGEKSTRFYDVKSGRLVKSVRTLHSSSLGDYKRESTYENYREFDGVWFATKISHTMHIGESTGTQVHTYDSITINGDVDKALFEVPDELKDAK